MGSEMCIRDRVMTYRETAGLSHNALAERTGLTPEAIDQFEHGWLDLPITDLATIAEALGTSLQELLDIDGTEQGLAARHRRR